LSDIINEHEIRVWAIRSSGHHAVINWIASLFDQPVVFCNNTRPTFTPYFHTPNVRGKELGKLYYPTWDTSREDRYTKMMTFHKECLIYNHENGDFKVFGKHAGEDQIGKSRHQYDILILRSFKNLTASWLKNPPGKWKKFENQIIPLYRLYADEFIHATTYLPFETVTIWFDIWIKDKSYRERKATLFGRKNVDWTLQYMANFFRRGSHFDDFKEYYYRAKELKVTKRYEQLKDHPKYIEFMKRYKDLHHVSNKIHKEAHQL